MEDHDEVIRKLRALVRRTCQTPLLCAGMFVAVDETQLAEMNRRTVATPDELLRALEYQIRTLQMANAYLLTQVPVNGK